MAVRKDFKECPPTFYDLDDGAILEALDVLELCKVVEDVAVQLEGEAGAMTGVLAIHQDLVDLLYHLLGTHLQHTQRQTDRQTNHLILLKQNAFSSKQ